MFLNTKQTTTGDKEFTQTTFYFNSRGDKPWSIPDIVSDLGGHVPSREDELFSPFYSDPSQRVLALAFSGSISVVKTETLLTLARERKGERLHWGEWRTHITWIERDGYTSRLWVSGSRLCCVQLTGSGEMLMDVYDFGAQASAECVESVEDGVSQRLTPSITQILPFEINEVIISHGCHDSLSFVLVKTSRS